MVSAVSQGHAAQEEEPSLNTRADARAQQSKSLLRQAFTGLLAQKPLSRITVKELCQKAGVNRSTFYAHYADVYDLLWKIEADMLESFQDALSPLLKTEGDLPSPLQVTTQIYRCLKENADVCTVTLGENGDKDFALKLLTLGREVCLKGYSRQFPEATTQQLEYFYAFASGGHMELLRRWMAQGMQVPPEEIAQLAEHLMLHGMEYLQGKFPMIDPNRKDEAL